MKFLAYLTKGVKEIALDEILEKVSKAEIERSSVKYLIFNAEEESIEQILELRTVDDVHLLLDFEKFEERPDMERAVEELSLNDVVGAKNVIEDIRSVDDVFSLTTSKYGNKNVDLELLEEELSESLESFLDAKFVKNQHSNFDIRIHFEEENMLVSVRLTEKPLYFRGYWQRGKKGSLKTSVAAALVRLANLSKGERLVDNFCGAGTVLCEAKVQGAKVSGGDIDRQAVLCARENLKQLDSKAANRVKRLDATSTSHPDSYFEAAVSNLPWGDQVNLKAVKLYSEAIQEYARILKENGKIVILGDHPDLAEKHIRNNFPRHEIKRLQLGFLGQTPTVLYAYPSET